MPPVRLDLVDNLGVPVDVHPSDGNRCRHCGRLHHLDGEAGGTWLCERNVWHLDQTINQSTHAYAAAMPPSNTSNDRTTDEPLLPRILAALAQPVTLEEAAPPARQHSMRHQRLLGGQSG